MMNVVTGLNRLIARVVECRQSYTIDRLNKIVSFGGVEETLPGRIFDFKKRPKLKKFSSKPKAIVEENLVDQRISEADTLTILQNLLISHQLTELVSGTT